MNTEKELAYRYDLFITPDWRDRFDTLINENAGLQLEGRILDVNCGTGAHALELAEQAKGKGDVIGVDPDFERLEIARAKAQVKKTEGISFEQASATALPFESGEFDVVIGDASMLPPGDVSVVLAEMLRVARSGARLVLKLATKGSFDEFFSVYWEALQGLGIVDEVWGSLERKIEERRTVSDAERMAEELGLRNVETLTSKEEFAFETGRDFVESPLIQDYFLSDWLSIVPEPDRRKVYDRIVSVIETERHNAPFDVSIKATLLLGVK